MFKPPHSTDRIGAIQIVITAVRQGDSTPSYDYKSVYKVQVTLNNGGTGWEVGDSVTVTQERQGLHH